MKRVMLILAALSTSQIAEAAQSRWQGEIAITGKSGTCPDYDPVGTFGRVRFRPGIGGDNGSNSMFSVFSSRGAASYFLSNHMFDATFRTVSTMVVGDGFSAVTNVVKVKFGSQKPDVILATTDFMNVRGQISGFDFMPLCTVNFKMTLFKRID